MRVRPLDAARAARDTSPETAWSVLAPLMAARGRVRISRDGGRTYRARDERPVTETLPNQPAALLVYDHSGCAPIICLDLDASRGGPAAVDRDHAALSALLDRVGARWFSDHSPNGGRHIYVPLSSPAPFHEARALTLTIAARTPTLDPLPMLNLHAGCIRPPGARHRTGGHQVLDQSISAAADIVMRPTGEHAWRMLLTETATPLEQAHDDAVGGLGAGGAEQAQTGATPDAASVRLDDEDQLDALPGVTSPDATFTQIARTGQWPAHKYRTASEARQGVIWAAVTAGWSLADVASRLSDGTWPGLASLYARYPVRHRHTALVKDWRAAVTFETGRRSRRTEAHREKHVRLRTTSPHKTHAPGPSPGPRQGRPLVRQVNREVRVWLAAVDLVTRHEDPSVRTVLYALGEAAALTDNLVVEHGNRSLAIATGLDQSTVGRILRSLAQQPLDRALVDLVRPAEGVRAHSYSLVIPDLLRPACEKKPWRRGKIHAVRPVFRELGLVAAFVYAALEQADEALSGRDLARLAGVGHSAAYDALAVLGAWGLAQKASRGGWVLGGAAPARVAEQFDVHEQVAAQVAKYRAERVAWWRYLGLVDAEPMSPEQEGEIVVLDTWRRGSPPPPSGRSPTPPPSADGSGDDEFDDRERAGRRMVDEAAAVRLLEIELGAVLIG